VIAIVALSAVSPSAHHSFSAEYFEEQKVTIEGDVTAFELVNPHSWIRLIAADENGRLQNYAAEWSNAARLRQLGFTPESIRPGDRLVLTGSPGRNPADHKIHLKTILRRADGWKWPKSGRDDDP
jgi:uncharacterized protein DUF6152